MFGRISAFRNHRDKLLERGAGFTIQDGVQDGRQIIHISINMQNKAHYMFEFSHGL